MSADNPYLPATAPRLALPICRPVLSICAAALLLLVPTLPAGAQTPDDSGWGPDSYGLKAGLTSATVSFTPSADRIRRRRGLAAMAFAEWLEASYVSLLTEAGYTQRGYTAIVPIVEGASLVTERRPVRFDHLTVAALARVRYPGAAVEPYAVAGPRGDVFLSGESALGRDLTLEGYEPVAFGATIGVGVESGTGVLPVPAFLEVRYNADLTDSLACCPDEEMRHRAVDILLGIKL